MESSGRDKGEEGAGLKVQVDFFYPGSVEGPVWEDKDCLAASQIKGGQQSDEEQKAQVKQIQFTRVALIIVEIIFYIQFRNTFLFF